jgi:hypothetical protein
VTVTVAEPVAAVAEAVSVRVELLPVVLFGLNAAVTPVGRPLAARVTAPVNPPVRLMLMVTLPLAPCVSVDVAGAAESV